jgi:hypothetical protein
MKNKNTRIQELKQRRKHLRENLLKYQPNQESFNKEHLVAAMHSLDAFDIAILKDGNLTEKQKDEILNINEEGKL